MQRNPWIAQIHTLRPTYIYSEGNEHIPYPLSKIDSFHGLLEENSYCLAGRKPMTDFIPFILGEEKQQIHNRLNGQDASIAFDQMVLATLVKH